MQNIQDRYSLLEEFNLSSLKKNLIFLGALESKGFIVTMRDGILKVTLGYDYCTTITMVRLLDQQQ